MSEGLVFHMQRESWQFFGSMTYRSEKQMAERVRRDMQVRLLRRLAELGQCHWKAMPWVIREELGEATGRLHWHFLLGGLQPWAVRDSTCLFAMGFWEGLGGGMARIRTYSTGLSAVEYICKGLDSGGGGANRYELGKFNSADGTTALIPARCLARQWGRLLEPDRRRRKAREMRESSHTRS